MRNEVLFCVSLASSVKIMAERRALLGARLSECVARWVR